ncbi:MAG: competence protein ComEC, partial [Solirubrobacteraceae bacterium]|nr:competence protein ComEC [Solirubrobacteraceae bacterium]
MSGPAPRRWVAALLDHPRHVALGALVGGLLLGPALTAVCWWAAAALVIAALAAVASAGELGGRLALVLALAAAALPFGGWLAAARLHALDRSALGPWIAHAADLRATVLQAPRARTFGRTVALASVDAGPGRGERVLIEVKGAIPAGVGEQLRVRGGFRALPDFEQAARRAGAHALLAADAVTATGVRRGGVLGAVDAVRRRAERALAGGLPPALSGLARGMVLGEDDQLTPGTTADFRASGLAHLVAASGSNVALLAAMVLALGALVGLPRTPRLGLALVLVAGYVPLAGGGPSIQRAGIMGAATLVAALASQPASRVYALLLAAASTLALNPRSAGDPGWQLSFAAVLGLMALAPPLRAGIARRWPRLPGPAAEALAVCLAAAASTMPLIAVTFGRLSWVTVPANLLAVPVVAPVMWLGATAAVVGQASVGLAAPLMALAAWPLAFLTAIGHLFATLPGAQAPVALPAAAA